MAAIENMNSSEERAVAEFQLRMKNAVPESLTEDKTLFYRFLKARDFDLDKAEKMLQKHLRWRKANQIDAILDDFKPKECFKNYIDPSVIGFSKEGHVVLYSPSGKFDINEIFKCLTMNDFVKHFIWMAEKNVALVDENHLKTGLNGYQGIFIMDLDKLAFATVTNKLTVNALLQFTNQLQDNYPERLKAIFVINAPSYYVLVWSILKSFMSSAMVKKIHFYGNTVNALLQFTNQLQDNYPERLKAIFVINAPSYYVLVWSILKSFMSSAMVKKIHFYGNSGWEDHILDLVDADVVPAFLGGNRTDPDEDPSCKTIITHDVKIPERLFLTSDERYFSNGMNVRKVTVPASDKKEVYVDVKEVELCIQWEFFVKGKDIGFGLFFLNSQQDVQEEIIPIQKYCTSDGTEKGFYKCPSAGRYIILLDNSYSWMSSKYVEYCITVLE